MSTDLETFVAELIRFRDARNWSQFHTPRNLAMAVASEVGELLAELRWTPDPAPPLDAEKRAAIAGEVADVAIFLLLFCESLEIDLMSAMRDKLQINEQRFPAT